MVSTTSPLTGVYTSLAAFVDSTTPAVPFFSTLEPFSGSSAELPEKGSSVEKNGTAGVVESTKAASDVYTPVSGEVVDTNQAIVDDPSKINQDPEDSAWFFKLKIKDPSEMDTLMNKDDYDKFAKETSA